MASDRFSGLTGEFEHAVYGLDELLMSYARNPNEDTARNLEGAASQYGRLSAELGSALASQLVRSGDREDAAIRLTALMGLDAAVAIQAGEVAVAVNEPAEDEEEREPEQPREDDLERTVLVTCRASAEELIPIIRRGVEAFPPRPPWSPPPSNPHASVKRDVDEIVGRAFDDMNDIVLRGALTAAPFLGRALPVTTLLSQFDHDLPASLQRVADRARGWWRVGRRLAVRGWAWVTSKLSNLVGSTARINGISRLLDSFIPAAAKGAARAAFGNMLAEGKVIGTCDKVLARLPKGKQDAALRATSDVVSRHKQTRRWVRGAAYGLTVLGPLHIASGGTTVSIQIIGAIVLLIISYVLAHDYLDSTAPPPLPNFCAGIRGLFVP